MISIYLPILAGDLDPIDLIRSAEITRIAILAQEPAAAQIAAALAAEPDDTLQVRVDTRLSTVIALISGSCEYASFGQAWSSDEDGGTQLVPPPWATPNSVHDANSLFDRVHTRRSGWHGAASTPVIVVRIQGVLANALRPRRRSRDEMSSPPDQLNRMARGRGGGRGGRQPCAPPAPTHTARTTEQLQEPDGAEAADLSSAADQNPQVETSGQIQHQTVRHRALDF